MQYNMPIYLCVFLPAVLGGYYLTPKKYRWAVLLLASFAFYLITGGALIVFILASSLFIYAAGLWLERINQKYAGIIADSDKTQRKAIKQKMNREKKIVTGISASILIGVLIFLKYFNFFGSNINGLINNLFGLTPIPTLSLMLPLGISFYTLQAVSYITDVYRGTVKADKNLFRVCLFLTFFPQLIEGPICRYSQTAESLYNGNDYDSKNIVSGFQLIIWGLFKKIIIADRLNVLVNQVFSNYSNYGGAIIAISVLCYTIQLYCDFSGCMHIVRGSGELFGIIIPKNFERPFFSGSVSEFWRRWHISLGTWFKDYLFYPVSLSSPVKKLGKFSRNHFGNRAGKLIPAVCALFLVWFSTGLWHGASWKYAAYGLYYFILISLGMVLEPEINKIKNSLNIKKESKLYKAFQIFRTFVLVNFGMLIFRADNLQVCINMFTKLFTDFNPAQVLSFFSINLKVDINDIIILIISCTVLLTMEILRERGLDIRKKLSEKPTAARWAVYYACVLAIIIFGAYGWGYSPSALMYASY